MAHVAARSDFDAAVSLKRNVDMVGSTGDEMNQSQCAEHASRSGSSSWKGGDTWFWLRVLLRHPQLFFRGGIKIVLEKERAGFGAGTRVALMCIGTLDVLGLLKDC